MIKLSEAKDKRYKGRFNYLVSYDYSSGREDVYNIFILNVGDPITIGRELPLKEVRKLITDYEKSAKQLKNWMGERNSIFWVMEDVKVFRAIDKK